MSEPTPPTDLAAQREAEKKLAETPAGFLLFEYIKLHDSAWSEDNILGMTPTPSQKRVAHVRELFAKAAQFRAALVHTLLHPPEEINIVRMLDVSTTHLTEDERARLVVGDMPGQHAVTDFGGILRTSLWDTEQWGGPQDTSTSETLDAVMKHALGRGCRFVLFDADAPELPGFPTFED